MNVTWDGIIVDSTIIHIDFVGFNKIYSVKYGLFCPSSDKILFILYTRHDKRNCWGGGGGRLLKKRGLFYTMIEICFNAARHI